MEQKLEIRQIQQISHSVIQINTLLALNAKELEEEIMREAEENPVLEVVEDPHVYHYGSHSDASDQKLYYIADDSKVDLKEHLSMQAPALHPKEKRVFDYLLDCFDEHGYLDVDEQAIAQLMTVHIKTVIKIIDYIRAMEPSGIGAKNLVDCLCLQLKHIGMHDSIAYSLVQNDLKAVANRQLSQLAKKYNVQENDILDAINQIRDLNPHPASGFSIGEQVNYIYPDILINRTDNGYQVVFNHHLHHIVRLRDDYKELLKKATGDDKKYFYQKSQRVSLLKRSIELREQLIVSLAQYIVQKQLSFFDYGEGHLNSLRMQDAAEELHVAISSISRAVNGKFLECKWGIYPLKYFFVQNVGTNPVKTDVKKIIRQMIADEDKSNPYSDQKISELLKEKGIRISRRTVNKYRTELRILDAIKRKR